MRNHETPSTIRGKVFEVVCVAFFALSIVVLGNWTSAVAAESVRLVDAQYKTGPLNCDPPRLLIDWAQPPSDMVDGQPYVGAIKFQHGDSGRPDHMSLHAWTNPVPIPNSPQWVMYLTTWRLLGNPGMGIQPRVQKIDEPNPSAGNTNVDSRLRATSGSGHPTALIVDPREAPIKYFGGAFQIRLVASNGGTCTEPNLGRFIFMP